MRKYSFEFKKKVVMDYLEGKEGYKRLRKKYGMPDTHQIRTWISSYKKFGDKGIMGSNKNRTYSFEFKLYVVELYLTTEASYREVALSVGIYDPSTIVKWVNDYRKAGIDALRPKRKGMKHTVSRTKKNKPNKDNQEYLVVEHGKGDMSLYGYNQSALVSVGTQVRAGQPIEIGRASCRERV